MNTDLNKKIEWHWGWSAALVGVVLITLAFRYALPVRDGDLWFHMVYGKYFLENSTLIADHTLFSWSPSDNDTIYCTWLPDIFLYLLHNIAGLNGLFAFRYLCLLALVVSCFCFARKLGVVRYPQVWVICLIALLMSYVAAFIKPEIFTFLFMVLITWNWWHIREAGGEAWKNCYFFPLIMLIWVNSHAGYIFGAIFLILIALGEFLNTWFSHGNVLSAKCRKHFTIALLLAGITPFLTPYGYKYPVNLLLNLLPTSENVSYNQKIAAMMKTFGGDIPYHSFDVYADLAILILLFFYWKNFKSRNIEWSSLLANFGFALLYTRFYRTTFLWAPIFLFSSIYLLSKSPEVTFPKKSRRYIGLSLGICFLMLGGGLAVNAVCKQLKTPEPYQHMGFGISEANPVEEAEYIKKYFPHSRFGNTYDQGAYLLWKLWPENVVFFDSRHFPYRHWSDEFFQFMEGRNFEDFTEKYKADLWCIGHRHIALRNQLYNSDDWQLAFYGKNSAIFIRADIELPPYAPVVSPSIFTPKNLENSIRVFIFSCSIRNWSVAEKLLVAIAKEFNGSGQVEKIGKLNYFYKGFRAYFDGEYEQAFNNIVQAHPDIISSEFLLTNCLIFLAEQAWNLNDEKRALALTRRAAEIWGDNIYVRYNKGMIGWYLQKDKDGLVNQDITLPWLEDLTYFVEHASVLPRYNVPVAVAQKMLANEYGSRPLFFAPSQPRKLK